MTILSETLLEVINSLKRFQRLVDKQSTEFTTEKTFYNDLASSVKINEDSKQCKQYQATPNKKRSQRIHWRNLVGSSKFI